MQERNRESSKGVTNPDLMLEGFLRKIVVKQNLNNSIRLKREIKGLKKIKKGRVGQIIDRSIIYPKKVTH